MGLDSNVVTQVSAERVQELLSAGAQLVDVLPPEEHEEQHIAGAIGIPLKKLDAGTVAGLDRGRPVIVYCWDSI
jgi:rhodanese-related sulfurtransferase